MIQSIFISLLLLAQSTAPYAPTGKLVDIGGYRVHLHCTGEGKPTVMVLGGGFSFDWELVQNAVEKFTQVCTYDPSGTIWSDPGPGIGCQARVDEIHRLLPAAGLEGPFILVGYSAGAIAARLYAAEYASQVAGIVLVDHAFLPESSPPPRDMEHKSSPDFDTPPVLLTQTPIVATVEDDPAFAKLPERIRQMHRWADSLNPTLPTAETALACAHDAAAAEKGAHPLGRIPLVVVSTTNDSPGYAELQGTLLSLSENSRQLIAAKSFHSVEISEPDVITSAIRQVIEAARERVK